MNNLQSWIYRNPIKTIILFSNAVICIFLIIIELYLRINGYVSYSSQKYWKNIQYVDTLKVYNSFYTDSEGVFKANPNYNFSGEININSDGFRSIEFDTSYTLFNKGKKKLLLLGDSFTWGSSAKPITKSFANLVAKQGYLVYNTGIAGTDPAQYAFLAKKYIPMLKPDVVMVFFTMGNDIMKQERKLMPNKNLFYVTNQGWIYAYVDRKHIDSPKKILDLNLAKKNRNKGSFKYYIRSVFYRTVVGSRIWDGASIVKERITNQESTEKVDFMMANHYLKRIKTICENYNVSFMLFLIPESNDFNITKAPANLFEDLKPNICKDLTLANYVNISKGRYGHFNNSGHKKYAQFILSKLDKLYK